jgi:uncharacterized membrane protein
MQWLRHSFIAGLIVTVPLIISVAALVWIFQVIDGFMAPLYARILGRHVPGLGLLTTAAAVLAVGAVATNVIGRRLLQRGEGYLLRVPVFSTIYSPVKQIIAAFSPDTEGGFKRVVLVQGRDGRAALGFLTKEFAVDRGQGVEALIAVYVPTNHLYLGDVLIFPRDAAVYPDLTVEEGIRIFLTGGMAIPSRVAGRGMDHVEVAALPTGVPRSRS